MKFTMVPLSFGAAAAFVDETHRHKRAPRGHKYSLGALDENGTLRGVVMVGRPVARHLDDGFTLEINRCATDGTYNACSFLYAAARRAAFALGYLQIVTYTLASEGGASLRASGFHCNGSTVTGGHWDKTARTDGKLRWSAA